MESLLRALDLQRKPRLLKQALTHPSAVGKGKERIELSNQRLEFLGDAILGSVIAHYLYTNFSHLSEGELTLCKIAIVRKESLAAAARRLQLGQYVILSDHQSNAGGRDSDSILADCLEAVLAAVYLSQGLRTTTKLIQKVLLVEIEAATNSTTHLSSAKNQLQEKTQAMNMGTPVYYTEQSTFLPQEITFEAKVRVQNQVLGSGVGTSKKAAETEAAAAALLEISSSPLQPL